MEKITGGAYLFFWGTSHPTAAPSIYLVNDTRSDHLAGTSFADWYHSAEVTTTEEFEAALADTSVNSIDCIITDAFKYVPGEHVITRSLTIRSRDAAGPPASPLKSRSSSAAISISPWTAAVRRW